MIVSNCKDLYRGLLFYSLGSSDATEIKSSPEAVVVEDDDKSAFEYKSSP